MWTPDYYVYPTAELPLKVYGATLPNPDGSFSIYLNSNYPEAFQKRVLDHEIRHVLLDHFYQELRAVRELEAEAEAVPGLTSPEDLDWMYDPYGFPLGPMPEHAPDVKVIPLYPNLNAIVKPWKENGLLPELLSRASGDGGLCK